MMKKYKQTEIPILDTSWDSYNQGELKKMASAYYDSYLLGKNVKNIQTGVTIFFVKSGIKHALNFGQRSYIKFKAVKLLKKLLEVAEFKNFKNPDPDDGENIVGYMNFEAKANIEGSIHKLRIVVRITNEGKFYYHHAKKIR